ncbi:MULTISPECIES: hypothetical protein [Novosphingobium]|uniref:hypothetical protein n=1 Tax=Novosphingobium TaxID=165696 RepID=UPI001CD56F10|nr:hypothetical protein [Novosphingobium percolationis]
MARSPQGAGAQKKPGRKRAAKPLDLPPSPRALGIDDLMGEFAGMATPAPASSIDLDDILGELAGPADAPVPAVPAEPAPDLDALLDDLIAPVPETAPVPAAPEPASGVDPLDDILGALSPDPAIEPAADPLDDILGELPPAPAAVSKVDPDPLDDLLGEIVAEPVAVVAQTENIDALLGEAVAEADAPPVIAQAEAGADATGAAKPTRKRTLPKLAMPSRIRMLAGLGAAALASHALAFWLGTMAHTASSPEGPVVGESAYAEVEEAPVEGIARYAGKEIDARIDGKTMFEDEEFRAAVDELVGGPEASGALESLLPDVRATQPILRKGTRLAARACNPESCGLENLTVEYDIATKHVVICVTQGSGDPPIAASALYDEQGAREVPNCEGYPHPPKPRPLPEPVEEAEPDNPADITLSAGSADKGSISERIHAELAKMRDEKKRKRRYE